MDSWRRLKRVRKACSSAEEIGTARSSWLFGVKPDSGFGSDAKGARLPVDVLPRQARQLARAEARAQERLEDELYQDCLGFERGNVALRVLVAGASGRYDIGNGMLIS